MRNTLFVVLALCCFAILPGCALLRGQNETTTIGIGDEVVDTASHVLPPLRWTSPTSLAIYQRLAEAIVLEKAPDLAEFSEEQVTEAYTAIFENPTKDWSGIYYGWFSTFSEITKFMSDDHVYLRIGYLDEGIFERYRGIAWKTPHFFIHVTKYPLDRSEKKKEFGVVISPPEPKLDDTPAKAE